MDGLHADLSKRFEASKLLGYLNFSDGRPDPKFRRALSDAYSHLLASGETTPWMRLGNWLKDAGADLAASGSAAFRDLSQADAVLDTVFDAILSAYRDHHADLLAHQPDSFLFSPFFLARCCEAVLKARAGNSEGIVEASLAVLNDYVGYRPIALLETRPQTDFYPHEKVCPVPVVFANVGVCPNAYADLIRPALELLTETESTVREEACWDAARMDEMAIDPRAADHFHPVNKRPNVLFGEWDPHRIDNSGYYRRFILKQPTLDALLKWVYRDGSLDSERLFESAAVLAGTILMGAGVSGTGPTYYDSSVTLSTLVQKIARYRDAFYRQLLQKIPGSHGERLRAEAAKLKQPFAGVRQFLNQAIAAERALHLQERRLSLLHAAMGYPSAARERAAQIPSPSVRFSCEIRLRQTEADFANKSGDPARTLRVLQEAEELLHRGIDCGAVIDPWNILGYQGLFPIFPGRDDTVRDPRAEDIIYTIGRQFDRYAHALASPATASDPLLADELRQSMVSLAEWWDRFATSTVSDLPRVVGGERAAAAEHVSTALALWKQASASARDVKFWQAHREGFRTPAAFAHVIEALLDAGDFKASLALLITWLSERSADLPLSDPAASFSRLASKWLNELLVTETLSIEEKPTLLRRFFELLEANADDLWQVPSVPKPARGGYSTTLGDRDEEDVDEGDETYASAYEGMSYRDSTDDGVEGSVDDGESHIPGEFPLENDSDRFEERLRFLTSVGRLWRTAARSDLWPAAHAGTIGTWLAASRQNLRQLEDRIAAIANVEVPPPTSGLDGVIEYDRRRMLKGHLLDVAVASAVEMGAASRRLAAALSRTAELTSAVEHNLDDPLPLTTGTLTDDDGFDSERPTWENVAVRLERAIGLGDAAGARTLLTAFVPLFRHEPLLTHPPADGGDPRAALRAQNALQLLESLLARLPRLGLLRETFQLAKLARQMERNDPPEGRRISSFDQLFRTAVIGVVEALVDSSRHWKAQTPFSAALRQMADAFHRMWLDHSQSLRLSALEAVLDDADWADLRMFIRTFGSDLFTVRFLTLSNIRGILGQGVTTWLDRQSEPDAQNPLETTPKLVTAWEEGELERGKTVRLFEIVLQSLVEYYDEYRDYNTTTTQSDYGENLYILLDFLRLKASYDRIAWRLKPLILAHEVLCREGMNVQAAEWREFLAGKTTSIADDLLNKLAARENEHGMKLRTIRDRLEERFVSPLQIDQAAARVAPAAQAARLHAEGGTAPEEDAAFVAFIDAIAPLAASPVGVGLDIPNWLRRLEDELRKSRLGNDDDDSSHYVPKTAPLTLSDVKRQLADWDRPLND